MKHKICVTKQNINLNCFLFLFSSFSDAHYVLHVTNVLQTCSLFFNPRLQDSTINGLKNPPPSYLISIFFLLIHIWRSGSRWQGMTISIFVFISIFQLLFFSIFFLFYSVVWQGEIRWQGKITHIIMIICYLLIDR